MWKHEPANFSKFQGPDLSVNKIKSIARVPWRDENYADRSAIELAKKRADGQVEKSGAWKGDPFEKILITEFSR